MKTIQTNIPNHIKTIYHIADIHIPNDTNRHNEYLHVFNNLYNQIKLDPSNSIIVIVGDIIDKSNKISPECINLTKQFLLSLSNITNTIIIAGNHDDNVRGNDTKIDSLSAIIKDISYKNLHYFKETAIYNVGTNISFGVTSVFDESLIQSNQLIENDRTKICLFHGMVDSKHNTIPTGDYKFTVKDFDGYDMVLLGDIHKHYYLNDSNSIAYSGSLIQQNFGEHLTNHGGCIKWNVQTKQPKFLQIPNDYGYITINYQNSSLSIPNIYPKKSRIRINYMDPQFIHIKELEEELSNLMDCEIEDIKIIYNNDTMSTIDNYTHNENDFQLYLQDKFSLSTEQQQRIIDIHQKEIKKLEAIQNINKNYWKLNYLEFKNIMCYKNTQTINFNHLKSKAQLWGILGKNAHGKSTLVLVILFALYGKIPDTTKDDIYNKYSKNKNIYTKIEFTITNTKYRIERSSNKVTLSKTNESNWENISETHKKDTEDKIINLIGDVFTLTNTNISLQDQHSKIINSDNNSKLKIIKKILSLDMFDSIHENIKKYCKFLEKDYNKIKEDINQDSKLILTKNSILSEHQSLLSQKTQSDLILANSRKKNEYTKLNKKLDAQESKKSKIHVEELPNTDNLLSQKQTNSTLLNQLNESKDSLLSSIKPIDHFNKHDSNIHDLQNKLDSLNSKHNSLQSNIQNYNNLIKSFNYTDKSIESQYTQYTILSTNYNKFIQSNTKKIKKLEKSIPIISSDKQTLLSSLEDFEHKLSILNNDEKTLLTQKTPIKNKINNVDSKLLESLKIKQNESKTIIESITKNINKYNRFIKKHQNILELYATYTSKQTLIETTNHEITLLKTNIDNHSNIIMDHQFKYNPNCPECMLNKSHTGIDNIQNQLQNYIEQQNILKKKLEELHNYLSDNKKIPTNHTKYTSYIKLLDTDTINKDKHTNLIDKYTNDINKIEQEMENNKILEESISQNNEIDKKLHTLHNEINTIKYNITDINKELELHTKISNINNSILQLQNEAKDYQLDYNSNISKYNDIETQYNEYKEYKETIDKLTNDTNETYKLSNKIDKLQTKINNYHQLQSDIKHNNEIDTQLSTIKTQIKEYTSKNNEIDKQLKLYDTIANNQQKLQNIQSDILTITNEISELNYDPTLSDIDRNNHESIIKNIGIKESLLTKINDTIENIKIKNNNKIKQKTILDDYTLYENITNWKGYPLYLIQKKINVLQQEINKILNTIVDFTCNIKLLDNEKKGGDIMFTKVDKNTHIPIKNCSGFEKFILSISIRIGLVNISNYMTPNFIIIDEGFGSMDDINQKKLSDVFDTIKNKFDIILLITHKEELKEQLKNRITIKNHNISYL